MTGDARRAAGATGESSSSAGILVTAVLSIVLGATCPAEDWPQWLGPRRDGTSRESGWLKRWPPEGPPRLWSAEIGSGYSAVMISRGRLLLFQRVGNDLVLESRDALSGRPGWRFSYPTDYQDAYGYDGGPRCAPQVAGDRVIILGPKGILHAVDFETGKDIWRRDLRGEFSVPPNFFGTGATPLVEKGVIYGNLGGTDTGTGLAFALSATDGRLVWSGRTDGGAYASPALGTMDDVRQLFVFHRGGLSCLDPESGAPRWKFPWMSKNYYSVNAATPLVVGDVVFISATYGTGSAALKVKRDTYEVLWKDARDTRRVTLDAHWATPIHVDGCVYGFSGRHESGSSLRAVDLESGKVHWSWEAAESGLGRGSMLFADGHFMALGERGDLVLLRLSPKGHEEVARLGHILSYPAWTVPTLSRGLLYLRDLRQLICLDLRSTRAPASSG